jgi:hypothetical protein
MPVPFLLSAIAVGLTLFGVGLLTALDSQLTIFDFISRLNEIDAEHQSLANGVFMIAGVFWIGSIDATRRFMEPKPFDLWLRFSALAFAASYILSMVFPCDTGCPPSGSLNQVLHNTLVWALYAGPAVFAIRLFFSNVRDRLLTLFSVAVLVVFALMQIDALFLREWAGFWQRLYDLLFCLMWWFALKRLIL